MSRLKKALQAAVLTGASGGHDGLSRFGLLLERFGNYATFVTRELRQSSLYERAPPDGQVDVPPKDALVFDIGANDGADIEYYLRKGFDVVAIEGNPDLIPGLLHRFSDHVGLGRVRILNLAITETDVAEVEFHICAEDKLSGLAKPEKFESRTVRVPGMRLSSLVEMFGLPYYIKVDVEGGEDKLLDELFQCGHRPSFVSAEANSIDVVMSLVKAGYTKFKIVEGRFLDRAYYARGARNSAGELFHPSFDGNSSGPIGPDVPGPWRSAEDVLLYLFEYGLGWKDVHAAL